jgi:hypothetical protein
MADHTPAAHSTSASTGAAAAHRKVEVAELSLKVLLLGDSAVGKTCLLQRFTDPARLIKVSLGLLDGSAALYSRGRPCQICCLYRWYIQPNAPIWDDCKADLVISAFFAAGGSLHKHGGH